MQLSLYLKGKRRVKTGRCFLESRNIGDGDMRENIWKAELVDMQRYEGYFREY